MAQQQVSKLLDDVVLFDPSDYSRNLFWQTSSTSEQKVYSIISNYLAGMDRGDIEMLCRQFGKNLVRSVLVDKYKKMYKKGYISTNGIDIPLQGSYDQSEIYQELLGAINDC